jgi:hypothetical protein
MGYATLRVGTDLLETLGAGQEPISIERNKRSSSDTDDDEPRRSRLLTLWASGLVSILYFIGALRTCSKATS